MRFIGRKAELGFLEKCYRKPAAQFVFLYGRRRVGKTECLRQFSKDKACIWFSCTKDTDALQLRAFSQRLLVHMPGLAKHIDSFASWGDAFEAIPDCDIEGRKLVIIDEFPYAVSGNAAMPSILQNAWDSVLSREDVMLVLCGSSISFMEDELLSEKNPLYGRATGIWKMEPLGYEEAVGFFPDWTPQQQLEAYGILGGVPHYLRQFDPDASIRENVCESILSRGCALYSEADFLLRQELREPSVYNAVLGAVAAGETELNGIAQKTLLDTRVANSYLRKLQELRVVKKEFSVQVGRQEQTKLARGLWRVEDNFIAFWYAAAQPWMSELDAGGAEGVWDRIIAPHLNELLSYPFEGICRQWIVRRNIAGELPEHFQAIGRWWQKSDEIDVVALGSSGAHLLGECKFKNAPVGSSVLRELREKERAHFSKGEGWCYLFSKNGFTDAGEWAHGEDGVRLVGAEELSL